MEQQANQQQPVAVQELLPEKLTTQSQSASLSLTQRTVQPSEQGISVFAQYPPATDARLREFGATMAACFPQQPKEFWIVLGRMIKKDGLSMQRLSYIQDTLLRTHRYPTLLISDILNCDKYCKIYTQKEMVKEFGTDWVKGYCILKQRATDGRVQFACTAEAEAAGLEIERRFE